MQEPGPRAGWKRRLGWHLQCKPPDVRSGHKEGCCWLCTVSQSLRTGLLIYSQHPLYKLPPTSASGLEEERGDWGGWWAGSHILWQ